MNAKTQYKLLTSNNLMYIHFCVVSKQVKLKMKFLVAVLIIAVIGANASYIPKHLTIIGKIDNQDLHDFSKIIGTETIYQEAHPDESIESVVIFPKVIYFDEHKSFSWA